MWFKFLLLSTLICLSLSYSEGKRQKCKELEECVKGENDVSCIKRYKRHCESSSKSCSDCDCDECSSKGCSSTCNTCCANFVQPCSSSYCCYKTCHAQCASSACRKSCRSSCTRKVSETRAHTSSSNIQQAEALNITTVINLHNKINNTNEIDIPINVNSTNYNNFTIDAQNEIQGWYQSGQHQVVPPVQPIQPIQPVQPVQPSQPTQSEPFQPNCCRVVGPRQCVPQQQFPFTRCFHLRRKQCGSICSAPIMHAQQHQVCEEVNAGQQSCHNQLIYIPQPKTRCVYQQAWPYVSCGIQQENCEGCYGSEEKKMTCSPSCYQESFADGQYYRPGPVMNNGFGMNMMPFPPNIDNSPWIAMDPNKRNTDPNAINAMTPDINSLPSRREKDNGYNENKLPINVIQDGVSINEIPSSFNPFVPYPPMSYSPMSYPPMPPMMYPYWPPMAPYPAIGAPEGELPLFAPNNVQFKRGTNEKSENNEQSSKKEAVEENASTKNAEITQ